MLTPADLQAYLDAHAIPGEILSLETATPTVESAARAVGAHPDQIVKSVLFTIRDQPLLAIACGRHRIDRRKIAAHLKVGRKRVQLADFETVLLLTGYPAGAVPPFGHPQPIPTLLDPKILTQKQVYAGGGSEHALLRLHPKEIVRNTRAEIIPLLETYD